MCCISITLALSLLCNVFFSYPTCSVNCSHAYHLIILLVYNNWKTDVTRLENQGTICYKNLHMSVNTVFEQKKNLNIHIQ